MTRGVVAIYFGQFQNSADGVASDA